MSLRGSCKRCHSDAQFSEMFSSCVFYSLNEMESSLFQTKYTVQSICRICQKQLKSRMEVSVHYVSMFDYLAVNGEWSSSKNTSWANTTLMCSDCNISSEACVAGCLSAKICVVEFRSDVCVVNRFLSELTLNELCDLVINSGTHFTCAVDGGGNWILFDDMYDHCMLFRNISHIYDTWSCGWFFAVYQLRPIITKHSVGNYSKMTVHVIEESSSLKADISLTDLGTSVSVGVSGAVAERLRHRSREQKVPSSFPAWTTVLRRPLNVNFHRLYVFNVVCADSDAVLCSVIVRKMWDI